MDISCPGGHTSPAAQRLESLRDIQVSSYSIVPPFLPSSTKIPALLLSVEWGNTLSAFYCPWIHEEDSRGESKNKTKKSPKQQRHGVLLNRCPTVTDQETTECREPSEQLSNDAKQSTMFIPEGLHDVKKPHVNIAVKKWLAQIHGQKQRCTHKYGRIHTHIHPYTYACTYACMRAYAQSNTHTHRHNIFTHTKM